MAHARKTLTQYADELEQWVAQGWLTGQETFIDLQDMATLHRPDLSGSRRIAGGPGGDTSGSKAALPRCWPRGCRRAPLAPSWRPSPPPSTPILACGPAWRCIGSGARRPPNMVPVLEVWTQGVHAVSWRAPAVARRSKVRAGSRGRQAGSHASTSGPTWMSWTSGRAHNQGATLARWSFVVLPRHRHETAQRDDVPLPPHCKPSRR